MVGFGRGHWSPEELMTAAEICPESSTVGREPDSLLEVPARLIDSIGTGEGEPENFERLGVDDGNELPCRFQGLAGQVERFFELSPSQVEASELDGDRPRGLDSLEQSQRLLKFTGPLERTRSEHRHLHIARRERGQLLCQLQHFFVGSVFSESSDDGDDVLSSGSAGGVLFERLEQESRRGSELGASEPGIDRFQRIQSPLEQQQGLRAGRAEHLVWVEPSDIFLPSFEAGDGLGQVVGYSRCFFGIEPPRELEDRVRFAPLQNVNRQGHAGRELRTELPEGQQARGAQSARELDGFSLFGLARQNRPALRIGRRSISSFFVENDRR